MSNVTFGEDILLVMVAVGLISTFIVVLDESISAHRERIGRREELETLLVVSNYLEKEEISEGKPGVKMGVLDKGEIERKLTQFESWNPDFREVEIKVISFNQEILYGRGGKEPSNKSISLPVVYGRDDEMIPGRMVIWRDCP